MGNFPQRSCGKPGLAEQGPERSSVRANVPAFSAINEGHGMAQFEVPAVRVDRIEEHPGADALEIALVRGYRCVVKIGAHRSGDLVAYIPEDAIVPEGLIRGDAALGPGEGPRNARREEGGPGQGDPACAASSARASSTR